MFASIGLLFSIVGSAVAWICSLFITFLFYWFLGWVLDLLMGWCKWIFREGGFSYGGSDFWVGFSPTLYLLVVLITLFLCRYVLHLQLLFW
jgi:hypothetical protein